MSANESFPRPWRVERNPRSGLHNIVVAANGRLVAEPLPIDGATAEDCEAVAADIAAVPGNAAAAKWLYRLEYHDGTCGLWYDGSGNWCFERGIGSLDDSCKTKSLPMDYDERYRQDGRSWFSSCSRKEDLLHWYSREDAKRLLSNGFVFTRYLATEYREYDQQTVFIKESCLYREEIDFESLWKSSSPGSAAAMREALAAFVDSIQWLCDGDERGMFKKQFAPLLSDARAALAAPARNCDRFSDAKSARQAWLDDAENWDEFGSPKLELNEWLFVPAQEGKEARRG